MPGIGPGTSHTTGRAAFRIAQRLEARMNGNTFKANTVIAIKLARAVFFLLKNRTVFDPERLVAALCKAA